MSAEYCSQESYQQRLEKLNRLETEGIDPFPALFHPSHSVAEILEHYEKQPVGESEEAAEGKTPEVTLAGRLILFRAMGKNAFAQIQEGGKRIQLMFNREKSHLTGYGQEIPPPLKFFEKVVDLGDHLGLRGHLFRTHKGELTLYVKEATFLAKSLLPLPDKHAGLADKELRYRKRWLDLIENHEVEEVFKKRSKIISLLRRELEDKGFMEVETPILQTLYGGAAAKPFMTHLNSLDQEMYLRISLEFPLKKLIVGGLPKVFEIGRVFRNEGIDRNHNPEFTLLEAYAAYWDYQDLMVFVEKLVEKLALAIHGTTEVEHGEMQINFKAPWKRLTLKKSLAEHAGLDVDTLSDEELRQTLQERTEMDPLQTRGASRGLLLTFLFEELVEDQLLQPTHILDYPVESTPLCKGHRDPHARKEGLVERFESYVMGHELCNAYSELNHPIIQRNLLEEQNRRREAGDEEASPLDEEFLESICQGMPPTGGIGIGIDRLIMLLTNALSIRDVLFFPMMRRGGGLRSEEKSAKIPPS